MKIKFDSDQAYQLEAMQAVKDLFEVSIFRDTQVAKGQNPGGHL